QTFNKFGLGILGEYFPAERAELITQPELRAIQREIGAFPILSWDERQRDAIELFRAMKDQGYRPLEADREKVTKWLRTRYLELPTDGDLFDFEGSGDSGGGDATAGVDRQLGEVFDGFLRYEQELRARGKMDYQDQKLRPLIRLVRDAKAREQARQTYDEIIVDEAQDISRLDALLIWHVMGPQTTITLAGDDDQTIYEFKQASSVFLRDAARYFERDTFETFLLTMNYRSPEAILAPAQRLIAHNVERIEKSVAAARSDLGEVIVQASATPEARVKAVVAWIADNAGHNDSRFAWSDVGILAPSQKQLEVFDQALRAQKIPTKLNTGRNDDGTIVNAVELSTIHKAKGRQWAVAFLPLSSEGEMPTVQSVRHGNLEAERRAYYVSMSRAADILVVGYVRRDPHDTIARSTTGEIIGTSGASRFLFEAGLVTEWHDPAAERATVGGDSSASTGTASVADRLRQRGKDGLQRIGRIAPRPEPTLDPDASDEEPASSTPAGGASVPASPEEPEAHVEGEGTLPPSRPLAPQSLSDDLLHYVVKAERQAQMGEYRYAAADAWIVVESVIAALSAEMTWSDKAIDRIDYLRTEKLLPQKMISRLHRFRIARNSYLHAETKRALSESERVAATQEMIDHLRPFLSMVLRQPVTAEIPAKGPEPVTTVSPAPVPDPAGAVGKQARSSSATSSTPSNAIEQSGPTLYKIPTDRVMHVLQVLNAGGYDPERGRVIRQIGFHTVNAGVEFLPFQLGMILFGVRYFIPQTFRYASSPIFARFCERHCAAMLPDQLRRTAKTPVAPELRLFEVRIHELMQEILDRYLTLIPGQVDISAMLANRLESADVLQNGMNTSGVILEPLSSGRYPRPSWTKRS
ncbi:MAG TPA: 3'-5' exonuclease, partial [Thermomicrobiales bacterium]|nr:3'-5' exonuclease [Thermomicrobiales bacterium]